MQNAGLDEKQVQKLLGGITTAVKKIQKELNDPKFNADFNTSIPEVVGTKAAVDDKKVRLQKLQLNIEKELRKEVFTVLNEMLKECQLEEILIKGEGEQFWKIKHLDARIGANNTWDAQLKLHEDLKSLEENHQLSDKEISIKVADIFTQADFVVQRLNQLDVNIQKTAQNLVEHRASRADIQKSIKISSVIGLANTVVGIALLMTTLAISTISLPPLAIAAMATLGGVDAVAGALTMLDVERQVDTFTAAEDKEKGYAENKVHNFYKQTMKELQSGLKEFRKSVIKELQSGLKEFRKSVIKELGTEDTQKNAAPDNKNYTELTQTQKQNGPVQDL